MAVRVDIVWRILEKISKKVKIEVKGPKDAHIFEHFQIHIQKITFFGPVTTFFNILQFSQKCAFRSFSL